MITHQVCAIELLYILSKSELHLSLNTLPHKNLGDDNEEFIWPTPYLSYLNISASITAALVKIIYGEGLSENMKLGSVSILSVINIDLIRIAKAVIDDYYASIKNQSINIDTYDYPVSFCILNEDESVLNELKCISEIYPTTTKSVSIKQKLINVARRSKTKLDVNIKSKFKRYDLQNECPLLRQHMLAIGIEPVNIRPELWSWTSNNTKNDEVYELVSVIISEFEKILIKQNITHRIINKAKIIARIFLVERLKQALDKALFIKGVKFDNVAGEVLVGGTPQQNGRLLNWKYQMMGRKVWRFAHGGDRAFYDDVHWGLSELPYCGVYHVHGKGESSALTSKLERQATFYMPEYKPEIVAVGSVKNQLIWNKSTLEESKHNRLRNKKNIVLVAGSFLGEKDMGPFEFKMPDPLIADTQAWVIKTLKAMKYNVSIKVHPGGHYHNLKIQEQWGVPVLKGRFDDYANSANVYVFDFAGTAFFDALASDKGVVLLDLKNRPFNIDAFADLNQRCQIVSAKPDQFNRIRFDINELKDAVEKAMESEGCPDWFADKYFWGDN